MATKLLVNPQLHQRGVCHPAKEGLAVLHLQQAAVVDDKFEGNLQRNGVLSRSTRRLRNPRPEMLGASGRRRAGAAVIEEVLPDEPELVQDGLGLAAGTAVEPDMKVVRDNPERRIAIIMGRAAHGPLTAVLSAAAAAFHNLLGTLPGRAAQRERGLHHMEMRSRR
jgi:hypothetical protein